MDQGNFFKEILAWVASSTAAAVSFGFNVVGLILSVWGFVSYFQQKREYRLLFGMLQEYSLKERIKADATLAKDEREKLQQEVARARKDIAEAQRELQERLPAEARRAYYENAIPVAQKQIFDLAKQLESMVADLKALDGQTGLASPQIEQILSEEIRKHVSLRRDMERSESYLAILTGAAAALGIIIPYPYNLVAIPLAILVAFECFRLFRLWRRYYRVRSPKVKSSPAPDVANI